MLIDPFHWALQHRRPLAIVMKLNRTSLLRGGDYVGVCWPPKTVGDKRNSTDGVFHQSRKSVTQCGSLKAKDAPVFG